MHPVEACLTPGFAAFVILTSYLPDLFPLQHPVVYHKLIKLSGSRYSTPGDNSTRFCVLKKRDNPSLDTFVIGTTLDESRIGKWERNRDTVKIDRSYLSNLLGWVFS